MQLCHKAQPRFLPETLARLEADRVAAVVATGAFNENRRLFDVVRPEKQSKNESNLHGESPTYGGRILPDALHHGNGRISDRELLSS